MRGTIPLLLLLGVVGCDLSPECPSCGAPPGEPQDEIIAGVNLTQLFRDPLPVELSGVTHEWAERGAILPAGSYTVVDSVEADDGALWKIYEARDPETNEIVHYGLVRMPIPEFPGDVRHWPVLIVTPEVGRAPADIEVVPDLSLLPLDEGLENELVIGWLVYREQALRVGDEDRIAQSEVAPFDVDADDAVSFAQAITDREILATERRGILGHGRGGTAVLLAAHRFPEAFDMWVDLAGPSDFFLEDFKDLVRFSLEGNQNIPFPAFAWLEETIIHPLRDGELTSADARHEFLLRSPSRFLQAAEQLLVFHGTADIVVDIRHSEVVSAVQSSPTSSFLEVDATHERILESTQVRSEVSRRIRELLIFND